MLRRVKMLCGVAIGRTVTTSYVTAGKAESEMDPLRADLEAVLATFRRRHYRFDLADMLTGRGHALLLDEQVEILDDGIRAGIQKPSPDKDGGSRRLC